MRPWLDRIVQDTGPLELYDAHTHIGQNDPDGYTQTPAELIAALVAAGARGVVFPMHEPEGYRAANDAVLAAAEAHPDRLVAFCRVSPHDDALPEARRALDAGARGIKLHPRAERFGMEEPVVAELVALAHERRVPVLIHAGRGIPALGQNTVRLAERHPGRATDPGPRRDLRSRLVVARAARPPERPDRHVVVEPGRPRGAVLAGAAGERGVGERLPVRPSDRERGVRAALRAAGRIGARAGARRRGRERSPACWTGARRPTSDRRPAARGSRSTCCSSAPWPTCARPSGGSPPEPTRRADRARAACCAVGTDGPHDDVFAAVLEALDR